MSSSPLNSRPRTISTPSFPSDDEKELQFPFVLTRKLEGIDGLSPHTDAVIRKEKEFRASSPIGRSVEIVQLDGQFGQKNSPPFWDGSKKLSPPQTTPPHICNLFGMSNPLGGMLAHNSNEAANSFSDEEQVFSMSETGKPELDFELEEPGFDLDLHDFNEPPRRFHSLPHNSSHETVSNQVSRHHSSEDVMFSALDEVPNFDTLNSRSASSSPIPTDPAFLNDMGPFGEHPSGEHPSRTLFVRNINSNVEDDELIALFEQYGPMRSMYTQCKHRGFVMISYYDIRHAKNAMRHLQGKALRRRKLDIHYSIPKDNPSEKDQNQGTLVIFNLDPATTNDELKTVFGAFGEIKEVRETPNKKHHKFIEFYDVRDADKAMRTLNKTDIRGKKIKIEPSRPGGTRKTFISQINVDDDDAAVMVPNPVTRSLSNFVSTNHSFDSMENMAESFSSLAFTPSTGSFPPVQALPKYQPNAFTSFSPLSPPSLAVPVASTQASMAKAFARPIPDFSSSPPMAELSHSNGTLNTYSLPTWNRDSSIFAPNGSNSSPSLFSPRSLSPRLSPRSLSPSGSFGNGSRGSFGTLPSFSSTTDQLQYVSNHLNQSVSPTTVNGEKGDLNSNGGRKTRSDSDDKARFALNIGKVRCGEDTRTTLMIKNIPNKYNQKMLLCAVDERHRGVYDFFYLPIDFKNKCNVGYAFVNFIDPQYIINFYEEFNNKKWEKFNSEKVCEISYARIQGKLSLISHFQNSSLMCEDKKCRPIIFHSDGPNVGEVEPFPVGPNLRRRASNPNIREDVRAARLPKGPV